MALQADHQQTGRPPHQFAADFDEHGHQRGSTLPLVEAAVIPDADFEQTFGCSRISLRAPIAYRNRVTMTFQDAYVTYIY
jgi:hypothetical protein